MISEEELITLLATEKEVEISDAIALQTTSSSLQTIFMRSEDVHAHTANIGKVCRDSLLPIDDKYGLHISHSATLTVTVAEILAYCDNDTKVRAVLERISASAGIEAETGLNVQDMLIRAWSITKHIALSIDHKGLVIDSLRHNIEAGGGCMAGISARLVAPYSLLLNQILQNMILFQKHSTLPTRKEDPFEGLEEALALSMSTYECEGAGKPLDTDLERAIADSLKGAEDLDFLMAQRLSLLSGYSTNTDPLEEMVYRYLSMGLDHADALAIASAEIDDSSMTTFAKPKTS